LRLIFCAFSTENKAAASVEDIMAPSSRALSSGMLSHHQAKTPSVSVLTSTPTVASERPCQSTGRVAPQWLSRPPLNMMKISAMTPRVCA